jgi:uncharacterized protein YgbK (DUF1537 family)
MNHAIVIVADDLTGALDSAVAFSALGSVVTLMPATEKDDANDVGSHHPSNSNGAGNKVSYAAAVSTASRALSEADAHTRALAATQSLANAAMANLGTLFVKVDSTLRGHPAAHLEGALEAWRSRAPHAFAVICPALPIMGRTVVGGDVLDQLVPITLSAAANDPLTSADSATLSDIFPGARYLDHSTIAAAGGLTAALLEHDRDAQPGIPRNVCVDASTDADLDALAEALGALGENAVAVGSAGLAAAIARRALLARGEEVAAAQPPLRSAVPSGPSTLIFLTSLHPAARQQLAIVQASSHELSIHIGGSPLLAAPKKPTKPTTRTTPSTPSTPSRVVVVTTAERESTTVKVDEGLAANIANQSALLAANLLRSGDFDSLLIIGGDGASALLRALGAEYIRITGELLSGVPMGLLRGGEAHGITVATRSGGFGDDNHLNDILATLHHPQRAEQPQPKDPA